MLFPKDPVNHRLSEAEKKTDQTSLWSREGKLVLCEVSADIVGPGTGIRGWFLKGVREQHVVSSLAKLAMGKGQSGRYAPPVCMETPGRNRSCIRSLPRSLLEATKPPLAAGFEDTWAFF